MLHRNVHIRRLNPELSRRANYIDTARTGDRRHAFESGWSVCLESTIFSTYVRLRNDDSYERIIKRVLYDAGPAERIAARRLLGWLLKSVRPLKWHEIQGAAAYNPSNHSFDLQGGKLRKGAKRLCGSLVKVYEDDEIRLVHLSAKMYVLPKDSKSTQLTYRPS